MRRTIVCEPTGLRGIGELIALDSMTGAVHQLKFHTDRGPVVARPGYRLCLVVDEEPIGDAPPCDERLVERARDRLRTRLLMLVEPDGCDRAAGLANLRELTEAIEDLVAARIGRALRIHCDADHSDDY